MDNIGDTLILNNTLTDWLISLSIILFSLLLLRLFRNNIIKRIKTYAEKTETGIDDFLVATIQTTGMPLLFALAVYAGLNYLDLPEKVRSVIHVALLIVVTFYAVQLVISFINYGFTRALSTKEDNDQRRKQARGIMLIIKIAIWIIGILFLINNLGYNINTLIAGMGIGGIAIALAAQAVLGDLFSYLVIFFDKPFEIGDFITIGDKMGTIEYIGVKTTRLKTLSGEQLICSNTDLTNSRVNNYKRMQERRISFSFGLVYNTPAAKLKIIPILIKRIIDPLDNLRFDRAHFHSFGDFSLNFEVVYYVLTPDYNLYMDKQQAINLKIVEIFEKEHIEFAFPTQTVLINKIKSKEQSTFN